MAQLAVLMFECEDLSRDLARHRDGRPVHSRAAKNCRTTRSRACTTPACRDGPVAPQNGLCLGGMQPLGAQDALGVPGCDATQNGMPGDGM